MKTVLATALLAAMLATAAGPAAAQSCYDLWYERNLIYAENGYCFSSSLGQRAFANYECWTTNPALTPPEQRRVAQLKGEEDRRGCRVNQ